MTAPSLTKPQFLTLVFRGIRTRVETDSEIGPSRRSGHLLWRQPITEWRHFFVAGPETQIGSADLDVFHLGLGSDCRVRVRDGRLQGIEGTAVRSVTGQRIQVELQRGVFLELDATGLETVD